MSSQLEIAEAVFDRTTKKRFREALGVTGVVGTGRVGGAWSRLLAELGVELVLYDPRTEEAERLARSIGAKVARELSDFPERVDTLFFATPDDQIARAAETFAEVGKTARRAAHFSGSRPSSDLKPLSDGTTVGSLHPIQSFRGAGDDWRLFLGCGYALEGEPKALQWLTRLVDLLGGRGFVIQTESKALYHAACVAASNFLAVLWNLVERLALQAGLTPQATRELLSPLAERTLQNLSAVGPLLALTGPFARGDVNTVASHVEALNRDVGFRERTLYLELARAAVALSRDAGNLSEEQGERLVAALAELTTGPPEEEEAGSAFALFPEDPSEN